MIVDLTNRQIEFIELNYRQANELDYMRDFDKFIDFKYKGLEVCSKFFLASDILHELNKSWYESCLQDWLDACKEYTCIDGTDKVYYSSDIQECTADLEQLAVDPDDTDRDYDLEKGRD